jgi:hypothetical protein
MKKKIYFDSNVFDHIHKCIGISKKNIKSLLTAFKTGKISVLASILNIEEILFIHKQSPSQAKKEIKLILQMTDLKKRMIKPPDILLREDIDRGVCLKSEA